MVKTVSIFAGSAAGTDENFIKDAKELGRLIGQQGWNVVCGDGGQLVDAVAKSAKENGSRVANIVTLSNIHQPTVGRAYRVKDVYEQQAALNAVGNAYLTLPGSGMTLAEFFSSLVHGFRTQSTKINVVLNTNKFFSKLFEFFESIHNFGFSKSKKPGSVMIEETPQKAIDVLCTYFGIRN